MAYRRSNRRADRSGQLSGRRLDVRLHGTIVAPIVGPTGRVKRLDGTTICPTIGPTIAWLCLHSEISAHWMIRPPTAFVKFWQYYFVGPKLDYNMINVKCHSNLYFTTNIVWESNLIESGHLTRNIAVAPHFTDPGLSNYSKAEWRNLQH